MWLMGRCDCNANVIRKLVSHKLAHQDKNSTSKCSFDWSLSLLLFHKVQSHKLNHPEMKIACTLDLLSLTCAISLNWTLVTSNKYFNEQISVNFDYISVYFPTSNHAMSRNDFAFLVYLLESTYSNIRLKWIRSLWELHCFFPLHSRRKHSLKSLSDSWLIVETTDKKFWWLCKSGLSILYKK